MKKTIALLVVLLTGFSMSGQTTEPPKDAASIALQKKIVGLWVAEDSSILSFDADWRITENGLLVGDAILGRDQNREGKVSYRFRIGAGEANPQGTKPDLLDEYDPSDAKKPTTTYQIDTIDGDKMTMTMLHLDGKRFPQTWKRTSKAPQPVKPKVKESQNPKPEKK